MPKSLLKSSLVWLLLLVAVAAGRGTVFAQSPTPTPQATPEPTPLTAGQKIEGAARDAFLNPATYASTAIGAAITEARERSQPQKDTNDRIADGFSRFAISFATGTTSTMLSSGVYPALFKQDPRYFPSNKKGFGPRAAYAMSRVFVTRGDNGRDQPNVSRLGGKFSAAALANIWERNTPGHIRIGARPTFRRFGYSVGYGMLSNIIFKEFWPDIIRKIKKK
jgi:hypothetical protein